MSEKYTFVFRSGNRKSIILFIPFILSVYATIFAQAPANNNCANATTLTVNGGCTAGTTQNGTIQAGENTACFTAGAGCNVEQTVWYAFNTGSNTSLWLDLQVTNSPNCAGGYAVYGPFATPTCLPGGGTQISCSSTPPTLGGVLLNGLSTNSVYMIQVMGRNGGGGGDRFMEYCIGVEIPSTCSTCSNPCGPACGFSSPPTVTTVTTNCTRYDLTPHIQNGQNGTWCYSLTAINSTIDFNIIINQIGCSGGNISAMSWQIFNAGSCGSPIASGAFPTLSATGLTPGSNYVFCYSLTVASGTCVHTAHWPYWVGAVPLPLELIAFEANAGQSTVDLTWISETENLADFIVERSQDGIHFSEIGFVPYANSNKSTHPEGPKESLAFLFSTEATSGKTAGLNQFSYSDPTPLPGENFYRLRVQDENGNQDVSDTRKVFMNLGKTISSLFPMPAHQEVGVLITSPEMDQATVTLYDLSGKKLLSYLAPLNPGKNELKWSVQELKSGIYLVEIVTKSQKSTQKLIVE